MNIFQVLKTNFFKAAAISILLIMGCDNNLTPSGPGTTFNVRSSTVGNYTIQAQKVAENKDALIFVENRETVSEVVINQILQEFSNKISPLVTNRFGEAPDFDENGKIILLLLDIKDNYDPNISGSTFLAGYFNPNDFHITRNSNYGEILYIDINPGLADLDSFYSTIAHEFQHLIGHYNRLINSKPEQETWINEGLAVMTEHFYHNNNLLPRRSRYYYNTGAERIAQGNNFLNWDSGNALDYASSYLFFLWLMTHSNTNIIDDVYNSNYADYRAITEAVANYQESDLFTLKGASSEETWEKLLAHWFVATIAQTKQGLLGFKNWGRPGTGTAKFIIDSIITRMADINNRSLAPGGRIVIIGPPTVYVGLTTDNCRNSLDRCGGLGDVSRPTVSDPNLVLYGIDVREITVRGLSLRSVDVGGNSLQKNPDSAHMYVLFNKIPNPGGSSANTGDLISASGNSPELPDDPSSQPFIFYPGSTGMKDDEFVDPGPAPISMDIPLEQEAHEE